MNDDASSFTFASIGDLHVKDGQSGSLRELLQAISKSAGALVLCGDLTDTGTPAQAEILAFFFNVTATPEIYTLSLHDALPILQEDVVDVLLNLKGVVLKLHNRDHVTLK